MYSDTYLDYTTVATDYAAVFSLETMVSANPNSSAISVESFITSGHSLEDISNGSLSDNTTTTILDKVKDPSSVSLSGTLTSNDSKLLAENVTARTVSVSPIEQAETNITDETSGTTTGVIDITSDVQSTKIPVQQTISPKKSPSALAPIETFESSAKFHTFNFTDVLKDNSSEEFNKMETEFCNAIKDMFTDRDSTGTTRIHECEGIEFIFTRRSK
ncbi:uncharacterized protein LOC127834200 [Dreissena polymorpha]|uniref:uncharacterized protein LOC127834200 n=1 Tax=Dreissena polymorpha TaxID=45954 RepID=UPI00226422FA|nr:uncharacterized protein LOC127834200 [Dreissena polymorpha]